MGSFATRRMGATSMRARQACARCALRRRMAIMVVSRFRWARRAAVRILSPSIGAWLAPRQPIWASQAEQGVARLPGGGRRSGATPGSVHLRGLLLFLLL